MKEGVPFIVRSENYGDRDVDWALQSGPLLVMDGAVSPALEDATSAEFIRSGVGLRADGEICFALSHDPVTLRDFAYFFAEEVQCADALYLDGFISRFYFPASDAPPPGEFATFIAVSERKKS